MARKKVRNASSKPIKWTWDEIVALLAWLDFSLKYDHINFDATVLDRLSGVGFPRTREQIERKLKWAWVIWGQYSITGWKDIKIRGTSCLHAPSNGLNEDQKRDIALALEEYENVFLIEHSTPNRRLRSCSIVHTGSSNQTSKYQPTVIVQNAPTQGRKRKYGTDGPASSVAKHELVPPKFDPKKASKSRKRPKTYSKREQTRSISATTFPHTSPPRPRPLRSPQTIKRRSETTVKDTDDDDSDTLDERNGPRASREKSLPFGPLASEDSDSHLSLHDKKGDIREEHYVNKALFGDESELAEYDQGNISPPLERVSEICQKCIKDGKRKVAGAVTQHIDSRVDSSTETDAFVDPRLDSAISKISELLGELANRETELQQSQQFVEELERDIHYLNMANKPKGGRGGPSIEEEMARLQQQVHDLRNELQARRRLGTFTTLPPASRYQCTATGVDNGFEDVYSNIRSIFRDLDYQLLPLIPSLDQHKGILDLAQRIVQPRQDSALLLQDRALFSVDPVVMFRALTTAALHDWVFATDFPRFEDDSSVTLQAYRDLLATQDGTLALRNLDLAALELKIGRPEFHTLIINKEAQRLAVRLARTLAPFFTRNLQSPEEQSWDGFATWGDVKEIWTDRQKHLEKMFADALTTKASSCLNIEDYGMVIYAPGTKFDSRTMVAEMMDGTQDDSAAEGRLVEICIQAAVFAYARRPVAKDASVMESIISTENFVMKNEKEREGILPRVKAVVVLADVDQKH